MFQRNFLSLITLVMFALLGVPEQSWGQSLEQLKSLPRAQQEALARQMGIDLDKLGVGAEGASELGMPGEELEQRDRQERDGEDEGLAQILGFKPELKRFGLDLFDNEISTFAPTDNSDVPSDYVLGTGDELVIQLYGAKNSELVLQVARDGTINIPDLGPLNIGGIHYSDAKALISARISKQMVGVQSAISLGRMRAINVFMAGEVKVPGAYSVSALTTLSQALFVTGGPSEVGSLRSIMVKRGGKLVSDFDFYDLLVKGDARADIRLQSGDVVFVPVYNDIVEVEGAVKRPATYEIKKGETLAEVIDFAGGVTPSANVDEITLRRYAAGQAANKIVSLSSADQEYMDGGGFVQVFDAPQYFEMRNQATMAKKRRNAIKVIIQGEVVFPGTYYLGEGERISDLIKRAGGVNESAYLEGAVFTRENVRNQERLRARELADMVRATFTSALMTNETKSFDIETIEFVTDELRSYEGIGRYIIDLPRALAGRTDADIQLMAGDALYIPQASDVVSIFGEVRRAATHAYDGDLKIDDYIKMAAGVTPRADVEGIYIVKANGSVALPKQSLFSFASRSELMPGDTIIVPVDGAYVDALPFWRDVISIVYQGAVAVAAISGL